MTTPQLCYNCGTENLGTRFCESCGRAAPAATTQVETVGATVTAVPLTPRVTDAAQSASAFQRGSPFQLLSLVSYLGYIVVPPITVLILNVSNRGSDFVSAVLLLAAGVFAIVGAIASPTSPTKAFSGGMLGIGFLLTATYSSPLYSFYFTYSMPNGVRLTFWVLSLALLFFSWAISRPFRGPGYFALTIGIVLVVVRVAMQLVESRGDAVTGAVDAALIGVAMVGTVLAARAFEKSTEPRTAASA